VRLRWDGITARLSCSFNFLTIRHRRVVDYVLKTVLNGRLSYDEAVLVLPRSRGELETGQSSVAPLSKAGFCLERPGSILS
jgi:hypothetical protein